MKIYLDTIELKSIKLFKDMGLIDGITTNPSIMATSKEEPLEIIKAIAKIIDTSISVEMIKHTATEMIEEAKPFLDIGPQITIKLPMTMAGLEACNKLASKDVRVNVTLCFSLNQAILAAKAGAAYVSPFIGRMDDNGFDGLGLIQDIGTAFYNYPSFNTQILAASVRNTKQVEEVAKMGADVITISPAILHAMVVHDLTTKGQEAFLKAWATKQGSNIE